MYFGQLASYERIIEGILLRARKQPLDYLYGEIVSVLHISAHYNLFVFKEYHMCEWLLSAKRKKQIAEESLKLYFHIVRKADDKHVMAYDHSVSSEDEEEEKGELKYVMRNGNYVQLYLWSYTSKEENEEAGIEVRFVKDIRQWYP